MKELIKELKKRGKTVIMSTHNLYEAEKICTHFALLLTGKLLATGSIDKMEKSLEEIFIEAVEKK